MRFSKFDPKCKYGSEIIFCWFIITKKIYFLNTDMK